MKPIKIGADKFKIRFVDENQLLEKSVAVTLQMEQEIRLHKDHNKKSVRRTLLHEILHAINGELDEKDVEFLAVTLDQVLYENPHLIKLYERKRTK